MSDNHVCDSHNTIRPSSSSLIRAPSWSLGFGADARDSDLDHDEDCCELRCSNQHSIIQNNAVLSSSLPSSSTSLNHRHYCSQQNDLNILPNNCPKINIEIPMVYLRRKDSSSSSYHVYQLNIKTSADVEWSVYRRYSQFLVLHQKLKAHEPAVGKFLFPPKRRLNSKTSTIVQDRRRKLEEYIRKVCDYIAKLPLASADSNSYLLLQNLASNGPQQVSSRTVSIHEASSLTDSVVSEHLDEEDPSNQQEQQTLDRDGTLPNGESQSVRPRSRSSQMTGTIEEPPNGRLDSVRYLFYNFISPEGQRDEEFELAHLGN